MRTMSTSGDAEGTAARRARVAPGTDDFTVCIWAGPHGRQPGHGAARPLPPRPRRGQAVRDRRGGRQALGAADAATTELARAVPDADIVVLATPVRTILRLIPDVAGLMRPGAVLTDLGSTKAAIAAALDGRAPRRGCGGRTPALRERVQRPGLRRADLFRGRAYVLTPLPRTSPRALATRRGARRGRRRPPGRHGPGQARPAGGRHLPRPLRAGSLPGHPGRPRLPATTRPGASPPAGFATPPPGRQRRADDGGYPADQPRQCRGPGAPVRGGWLERHRRWSWTGAPRASSTGAWSEARRAC